METILKGDELMIFDAQGKSLALATSHTLNISAGTNEVNCKDGGIWTSSSVNQLSWTVDTENLFSETTYDTLFGILTNRTPVTVYFGTKQETGIGDVDTIGTGTTGQKTWTKGSYLYKGKAVLTSLNVNAASGNDASFSASFQGVGALTKEA